MKVKSLLKKIINKDGNGGGSGVHGGASTPPAPISPRSRLSRFSSVDLTEHAVSPAASQRMMSTQANGVWQCRRGVDKVREAGRREVLVFTTRHDAIPEAPSAAENPGRKEHYDILRDAVRSALLPPSALREPAALCADALARHKTFRHPNILGYVSGHVNGAETQLVTEPAIPLRSRLASQSISLDELCLGVVGIGRALLWLHKECQLAYNNVSLDGVYVTQMTHHSASRWVLGDFSLSCPRDAEDMVEHSMAYQLVVAPEDVFSVPSHSSEFGGKRLGSKGKHPDLASRDIYGLGCLVDEILCEYAMGAGSAAVLRRDVLSKLMDEVESSECLGQTLSNTHVSLGNSSGVLEDKLAGRGLEALLGEVAAAIEWVDTAALPPVCLVSQLPDLRPLDVAEELALWSLGAMHRSPLARPTLEMLTQGRHLQASLLVRSVTFLNEERLMATEDELESGYNAVLRAFERCLYSDVVEFIAPVLCNWSAFLDPAADEVFAQLLAPRRGELSSTGLSDSGGAANGSFATQNADMQTTAVDPSCAQGFPVGCCVEAMGLKRAPELNGARGCVVGIDVAENRVLVVFDTPNEQRAIKPDHLTRVQQNAGGAGVLAPVDYQRVVVPFLRQALQDKMDSRLRVCLLKRAKHFVGTFDHSSIVPEVVSCLRDDASSDALRSAACEAVPPLVSGLGASPKTCIQLVAPLHKIVLSSASTEVRAAAVRSAVAVWGSHSSALAVSSCTSALHDPALACPALEALSAVLRTDAVPPEEVAGVVVPLVSPLTLSTAADVRRLAHNVLHIALANLGRSQGLATFPPTRPLPSPASIIASLPRTSR